MGALGDIIAAIALKFLREWLAREDIKRGERQRLIIDQLELDGQALAYLAEARGHPDLAATGRVRDGARAVVEPGDGTTS